MSLSAAVIRELVVAGLSGEALVAACERIEAAHGYFCNENEQQRTARQNRNARYYDAHKDRLKASEKRLKASYSDAPSLEVPEVSPKPPSNLPKPFPKKTPKGVQKGVSDLIGAGCSESLIADWQAVRKAKDAGPITETVAAGIVREAAKAGVSPAEAIRISCERGWQGFKADWVSGNQRAGPAQPLRRGSAAMFDALDRMIPDEQPPNNQAIPASPVRLLSGA